MDTDKKIEIALNIADELSKKILKNSREPKKDLENLSTELSKAIDFLAIKDFDAVLKLSDYLSNSIMLRPRPQKSYRAIKEALYGDFMKLSHLGKNEIIEILGYTRRMLVFKLATIEYTKHKPLTRRQLR